MNSLKPEIELTQTQMIGFRGLQQQVEQAQENLQSFLTMCVQENGGDTNRSYAWSNQKQRLLLVASGPQEIVNEGRAV